MRRLTLVLGVLFLSAVMIAAAPSKPLTWHMNATIIEACSCPMFCQCYFSTEPAEHAGHEGHGGGHFCKFNNAYRINKGHYGDTKLDGLKFWVGGDLGSEFQDGEMEWAVLHFDKPLTSEQRKAIQEIVGHVYPVKWKSFKTAEGEIVWNASRDVAHATLDGGKTAEVKLKRHQGMTDDPVVIKNLVYWGVPRNDGFVLMPNEVEAYRVGDDTFEFKGTNGFMITFDISSKDVEIKDTASAK